MLACLCQPLRVLLSLLAADAHLAEQGLAVRARHVPVRLASMEDLCLVHDEAQVRLSTGSYPSDGIASQALGLDSDTYFAGPHSGHAAKLSAGSVVEVRVAWVEVSTVTAGYE